jgi:tripartite-type tricarboxylate transporter receptor subunit TctC
MKTKVRRRKFLSLLAGSAVLTMPRLAHAESYPSRPVRFIIGYPPGGSADITARQSSTPSMSR